MSFGSQSSRVGISVPPIEFEGKRYKQVLNGQLLDLPERTGLLMILDAASNARLDIVKIYQTPLDPQLEADVQDVFFTKLELLSAQRELLISNERGEHYVFNIDTKVVSRRP